MLSIRTEARADRPEAGKSEKRNSAKRSAWGANNLYTFWKINALCTGSLWREIKAWNSINLSRSWERDGE